jgi:anthranilate synthase/aminodeoxychorismate synthase-like glutamine amidotransferase
MRRSFQAIPQLFPDPFFQNNVYTIITIVPKRLMIFLLDNYDSFTFNLVQRIGEIDPAAEIHVERNDQISIEEIESLNPDRIIVSPGPCTPSEAGISRELIACFGPRIPVLGVCLGHQCLAEVYGAKVVRADRLMHGKTSMISHSGKGVFADLPDPFQATRYHSLIVPRDTVPDCLEVTAWVNDEGQSFEVMGLQHKEYPVFGVQFHPESFLTEHGYGLLRNFLRI